MALPIALLFLLLASPAAVYAVDHVVGGSIGWSLAGDYATWAAGETFNPGDNLIFNYGSSHGVDEVTQTDYSRCATSNAINSYTGGQTTINLSKSGPMYFFCPTFGHCGQGMKLSITVQDAAGTPSGAPPTTPSTPPTRSTSPSNGGTPTPTPPSTSSPASRNTPTGTNAASSSSISHLMLAISLLLAALIAFTS